MTTRIRKSSAIWIMMRYPEHAKTLPTTFTLAELIGTFLDSPSALKTITRLYRPDNIDIEQIDNKILYQLWINVDVDKSALECVLQWLAEFRGHKL